MTKAFDTWFLRKFLIFSRPSFAFHLENRDAIFCLGFLIAKSNRTDKTNFALSSVCFSIGSCKPGRYHTNRD